MGKKIKILNNNSGFTITEALLSIVVIALILSSVATVLSTATNINQKSERRTEATELAFSKVQDYINLNFSNIPIGDDVPVGAIESYEVENFTTELAGSKLTNATGKVFVEPESDISPITVTNSTPVTEGIDADSAFASAGEIAPFGTIDPTGINFNDSDLINSSYLDFVYNYYSPGPSNKPMPAIDLGSPQSVDTIRINWYRCPYTVANFRIEGNNSNSSTGWTTVSDGLSSVPIPSCSPSDLPQDFAVGGATFRYWRIFVVTGGTHPSWNVISQMEAFRDGSAGDVVEQRGSDASTSPGDLYLVDNDDLEMSWDGSSRGHQSTGIIFDNISTPQAATVDSAVIEFTAQDSDTNNVTLRVRGVDTDNALTWNTTGYPVDNAVDTDNSDGFVGTTAETVWNVPDWSSGERSDDTSVDVTSIVQEIVDRSGWVAGNNMAFAVQPDSLSDNDHRVAERVPAPRLVINWTVTSTTSEYPYPDADGDGDADDPTLLRIRSVIEYDEAGVRREIEYTTVVRQGGVSD